MRRRAVLAVFAVVTLAVLIGCKKRDKRGENPLDDFFGVKATGEGLELPLPPPPAEYPNTTGGRLAKALDEAAARADKGQEWCSRLAAFANEEQKEDVLQKGSPQGLDATAERALIDAGFQRLWRAHRKLPQLQREDYIHRHGEEYVARKMGTYEQGRARGASLMPPRDAIRINQADDVSFGENTTHAEADVADGTRAKWTCGFFNGMWVSGRAQFRESLELVSLRALALKLNGSAGELTLRAGALGSPLLADLDQMKTDSLVASWQPFLKNLSACIRVGPDVASIRYEGPGSCGLLLVRDNPRLTVSAKPAFPNKTATVTLIRY